MGREPGADERRMQHILKERGIGYDAPPPKPTERPRDWLDDLLDDNPPPPEEEAADEVEKPEPAKQNQPKKPQASNTQKTKKRKRPKHHTPDTPRSAWDTQTSDPRQSLIDAGARIPYRLKWLAYHLAAAYLGWMVGLVDWVTYVTAWITATGLIGFQAAFWYAAAAGAFLLHRRTRRWWRPVAFLAAVPASSTVVGVLLYGTPHP